LKIFQVEIATIHIYTQIHAHRLGYFNRPRDISKTKRDIRKFYIKVVDFLGGKKVEITDFIHRALSRLDQDQHEFFKELIFYCIFL